MMDLGHLASGRWLGLQSSIESGTVVQCFPMLTSIVMNIDLVQWKCLLRSNWILWGKYGPNAVRDWSNSSLFLTSSAPPFLSSWTFQCLVPLAMENMYTWRERSRRISSEFLNWWSQPVSREFFPLSLHCHLTIHCLGILPTCRTATGAACIICIRCISMHWVSSFAMQFHGLVEVEWHGKGQTGCHPHLPWWKCYSAETKKTLDICKLTFRWSLFVSSQHHEQYTWHICTISHLLQSYKYQKRFPNGPTVLSSSETPTCTQWRWGSLPTTMEVDIWNPSPGVKSKSLWHSRIILRRSNMDSCQMITTFNYVDLIFILCWS